MGFRIPRRIWRWLPLPLFFTGLLSVLLLYRDGDRSSPINLQSALGNHPVDFLIRQADDQFDSLLREEKHGSTSPADRYRARRQRHPPPGFDAWLAFAKKHKALINEQFFDQIYHDLRPFWGVEPAAIRTFAARFPFALMVRDGTVTIRSDGADRPWLGPWKDMVQEVAKYLPDMDIAMNVMDEPRVIVPWEKVAEYLKKEAAGRKSPKELLENLSSYRATYNLSWSDAVPESSPVPEPRYTTTGSYWSLARRGCGPLSPARHSTPRGELKRYPPPPEYLRHLHHGFVANWTRSKDACTQPHLESLHGSFIEPVSISTTSEIVPIFGGSKLSMNNDILLPPAMYYRDVSPGQVYSPGDVRDVPWKNKASRLLWRGVASGGRNRQRTWPSFHRHNFVNMLNGTAVTLSLAGVEMPGYSLPTHSSLRAPVPAAHLGTWLRSTTDAAFTGLECFPNEGRPGCTYTDPYFAVQPPLPFSSFFDAKYLPDIDGNSYSARYLAFLRSGSLPLKATLYHEWHDQRLLPWRHFVPMDNAFVDVYSIMEYFLGYGTGDGHDQEAEKIATQGKTWAEKVLRREDMVVYTFRLLLEYARISDDRREELGDVGDKVL